MMQIAEPEIIAVTLLIVAPINELRALNLDVNGHFPLLYRPAYVQRRSWSHAQHDIATVLFCEKKRRCSEIASTHVVNER